MRLFVLLALATVAAAWTQVPADDNSTMKAFPKFKIDLNQKPEDRFKLPVAFFRDDIVTAFKHFLDNVPDKVIKLFDWLSWTWWIFQHEKYMELKGIAETLKSDDIPLPRLVLINTLYELESWCTSIVARDTDGTVLHSRILDFDFADHLRKVTFEATFFKDGKYAFDSIMFAGTIGVYTGSYGSSDGAFSISENQRGENEDKYGLAYNLLMTFLGFHEISWDIRQVLEQCTNYECAHKHFTSDIISSFGYIIMAGIAPNEGAIISRNRFGVAHEDNLSDSTWFLVQTNNDHWDTGCYGRCKNARLNMEALQQANLTSDSFRSDVMLKYPNFNSGSIYNTNFIPAAHTMDTIPMRYVVEFEESGEETSDSTPSKDEVVSNEPALDETTDSSTSESSSDRFFNDLPRVRAAHNLNWIESAGSAEYLEFASYVASKLIFKI